MANATTGRSAIRHPTKRGTQVAGASAPRPRVAALVTLPVQYISPFFARLAARAEIDLTVLYSTRMGLDDSAVEFSNFGRRIVWDLDLLAGYRHKFLWHPWTADKQRRASVLAPTLAIEISRSRYDVLVNFGWEYPANWLAAVAARGAGIPTLLYTDTDVRDSGASAHPMLRRLLVRRFVQMSAGGLYTGTFNRDFYIRYGLPPNRLWFSPWAVDDTRFQVAQRGVERQRLGLKDEVTYFLFVGTLTPRKNVESLVRVVKQLQDEGRSAGLLVAGSGSEEASLRALGAALELEDVHWLGFINQSELPAVYAAADVFVLASWRDPRATVVNEAMASSLPVIVSSGTGVWGPADLVRTGTEGLVFDVGDEVQLAEHCRDLLQPRRRATMGAAAAARVRGIWNYDVAADGWAEAARCLSARSHAHSVSPKGGVQDFRR